jgi:hypothetical protein
MVLCRWLQMVLAFRDIKEKWPIFRDEPHNVNISLAVDGVNPFA